MSQDVVLKVLKRKKRWMTADEVADILKLGRGSVSASLRKLKKRGEIKFKKSKKGEVKNWIGGKPYLYRAK